MYSHQLHQPLTPKIIFHWFLLSLNAGAINSGGFLATGRFVSHVTGFSTLFGVNLVKQSYTEALGFLLVPLFFLIGAFLAGLLIDRQIYQNKTPHFDYVMGLSGLCLLISGFTGELSHYGAFGKIQAIDRNFFLLALTCCACGLQNAALTSSSGNSVRTTHLTGLTTDLGLGMARLTTLGKNDPDFQREKRSNLLRLGTIGSFVLGSIVGAYLFIKIEFQGFLICGAISFYASWVGRREKRAIHRPSELVT